MSGQYSTSLASHITSSAITTLGLQIQLPRSSGVRRTVTQVYWSKLDFQLFALYLYTKRGQTEPAYTDMVLNKPTVFSSS